MNSYKSHNPTESELEILQILWLHGPCSVRKVNELINESREVGYTTTLKIMQIMTDKALVTRDTAKRTHIYSAAVVEQETQKNLLSRFIDKTYRGSAMRMVMQALGNQKTNQKDLDALKSLIEKIENENQ